ncbi:MULTISPECIES: YggS family pyridoxal phosphate-dependent enzyme [unclassified Colwellia]|jgi:pyridoxal phosphate enzyme (YggS family)|uniref:YggS family pyridoxal phosphate-dependent enzyme n=1 Tax=unclassified Colwellia TaxID=196834 RepID=UPI0015F75066|nr:MULTISPECIES: YggS family pyridoxal phosphate-dependent enzyme [unclassified Colwellia]MBA6337601.1 YggS family pyridoxal phosphate-dependent enzyme [Colwellia sp. BRX8-7]MBA6351276.1 YggS family pyridoxal phosphate-dependent enzyme [Colwellia sp. BRX9-1]MBA6354817.1 YggS family pyridoxal phosphate-dependent enzyme [Colwellia sp. BRX8-3]MBA6360061.1 YggS family pyridoxal phosphate-dependent enzyme [Colwellia sp. BRX8-6]MBA6368253.1 YggS family pyridoxal phosphate-dependent enzyme [Colwellia
MTPIKDNLAKINLQIFNACELAKRPSSQVTLLAVSKTKTSAMIEQAYLAGQREFGENYIQEAVEKIAELQSLSDITWHFIGPIQSNKTRLIADNFAWVHSVDRIKVAKRLNDHRSSQDTPLNVCLQVNISGEESKSGIAVKDIKALVDCIEHCPHLTLRGLMAIPEKNASEQSFEKMQQLYTQLKKEHPSMDTLSMGMSGDLSDAIAKGSTMVRVGSAIFGAREDK